MQNIEYFETSLTNLLEEVGEEETKVILSDFYCKHDKDIVDFIKNKAILFEKTGDARTYLIFATDGKKIILVGYFAITPNAMSFDETVSRAIRKNITGYSSVRKRGVPSILLGQLAKNQSDAAKNGCLITGDDLLKAALVRIKEMHKVGGGRCIYLECKQNQFLMDFYEKHQFTLLVNANKEPVITDESTQLLTYVISSSVLNTI